jgi:WD40 repeat protein
MAVERRVRPRSDPWTVAIHAEAAADRPLGCGVVVDDRRVLTCAHVVADHSARTPVWVAFPKANTARSERRKVSEIRKADDSEVVMLTLANPVPATVIPAPLRCPDPTDLVGEQWWAFGFPEDSLYGSDAHGVVGSALLHGRVRLEIQPRYGVEEGFSGTGVWSARYNAVVALVSDVNEAGDALAVTLHQVDRDLPAENLRALASQLPPRQRRRTAAYWATVREIRQRTEALAGRQQELAKIASFATGAEGYRWLVGEPWAGKTALLAETVTTALPEHVDVVAYFLSRREADSDSNRFLAAVIPQLAILLDEDIPDADPHQFRALWARASEAVADSGRHLTLVVDGLDEDLHPSGLPSVAALLPALTGENSHVLVSSRPHPQLPGDVPAGHPLRAAPRVTLEPFEGAAELAVLARQELEDLVRRDDDGLGADLLGILTAAAGPLAVADLAALTSEAVEPSADHARRVRRLVTERCGRSLQPVGPGTSRRYQFAHASLLEYAQANPDLFHPDYRRRIHGWAERWQAASWPSVEEDEPTPRYLLETYPGTLRHNPQRLAGLVSDLGWIVAAIETVGVDSTLAELRTAHAAAPSNPTAAALLAILRGQAHHLRAVTREMASPDDAYVVRQLCLQAAELGDASLAAVARERQLKLPNPGPALQWTTRKASRALVAELGSHDGYVEAVAVLPDGGVVTGGEDRRVRIWNPQMPGATPVELGTHDESVYAVAVLPDGGVVTGGEDRRVRIWNPQMPGAEPVELGSHGNSISTVAVLPDGSVVAGDLSGRVRVWDPAAPGDGPTKRCQRRMVRAVAALPDGRLIVGGDDGWAAVRKPDSSAEGASPSRLGRRSGLVLAVAVRQDGRVVTGGHDGFVRVWEPDAPWAQLAKHDHGRPVSAVAVLPDGRVIFGDVYGQILLWNTRTMPTELGRHDGIVKAVAVLPRGRVVTGGSDGRVLIWSIDPAASRTRPGRPDRDDEIVSVAVLADGNVITGDLHRQVSAWDQRRIDGRPLKLGFHRKRVEALAALPDGGAVSIDDKRLLVWDVAAAIWGPEELGCHDEILSAMAVLPDGRVVTGDVRGRILMWNLGRPELAQLRLQAKRGAMPVELGSHNGRVEAIAALPDGRVVTSGNDMRVLLWRPDTTNVEPLELCRHDDFVYAVAALPDGRVVTGRRDGRVQVWCPDATGSGPVELGQHDGIVRVIVLPDGRVVTGGRTGRVRIWDVQTQTANSFVACTAEALAAGVTATGNTILAIAHVGNGLSTWTIPAARHLT